MKTTIHFNLEEEQDLFNVSIKAQDYIDAIYEIKKILNTSTPHRDLIDKITAIFNEFKI